MKGAVRGVAVLSIGLFAGMGTAPAAGQAPAAGCYERLPTERISLNLRDASVPTTLRLLAQQYRVNMVVTDDVAARVTLDFFEVPARDVFQAIIDGGSLRCLVSGNVLRVSTAARIKAEEDERTRQHEARTRLEAETRQKLVEARIKEQELQEVQARGPIKEATVRLSYADAAEVAAALQGILGLPPEGTTAPPLPLPGVYTPPPPVNIPATPSPAATLPGQAPVPSSEALTKGLTVRAYKPTNSIFIRYYENDLNRLVRLIREQLDIPLPQVQIAAQMVITTRNALEQLGVQWGGALISTGRGRPAVVGSGIATPNIGGGTAVRPGAIDNPSFTGSSLLPISPATGQPVGGNLVNLPTAFLPTLAGASPALGAMFGIVGDSFNLNLAIQALEVQGKARRVSEPKVVTVEHAKAIISRGFEVPFVSTPTQGVANVQFKEALLQLTVTPNVILEPDGTTRIRMKLLFENNEPDFSGTRSVAGNPSIFKRKNETEVVIKEGERLVIGGIQLETSASTARQVPVLGSIPVLGWLFKSREISADGEELLVILTPAVVRQAGAAAAR